LRPSSIVLLTRGGAAEVFLVERAQELSFFGGFVALPGGNVDPRDRGANVGGEDEDRALAICAARELFEETGVLLPGLGPELSSSARAELRAALLDETPAAERFWELVAAAPDALDALRSFGLLITPPFAPVRYRTRLYHLELPENEAPHVVPGELVSGGFAAPERALARWHAGEIRVVPPVVFLLQQLSARPLGQALAHAQEICDDVERGALHPVRCAPGILMAPVRTPTIPPATTTNTYLVGERRLWIVDPATPYADEQARLFALLDRLIAEGRELAGILVTHHHHDHVGAVAATARRYGLAVRAHARTLERLIDDRTGDDRTGDFERGAPIEDGESIELGRAPDGKDGWRLVAHHTPGHDQGHLVFVEDRYRAMIAGDLVSTLSTIVIDPPEGHMATYLASLRRALELDVATILPAHGPGATRPRRLLTKLLEHRQAREDKLFGALGTEPTPERELLPRVYDDAAPELMPVAARSLLAGLQKLAEDGRARELEGGWAALG